MTVKFACLTGLLVLGALAANAQTYWSTNSATACGAYGDSNGNPVPPVSGVSGEYVCFVYGTLPWYAAGAGWGSSIRVAAPPTGAVNVTLSFTDVNGNGTALDFQYKGNSTVYNDTVAAKALFANQPMEVDLLGLKAEAPTYGVTEARGPVVVYAECPDAITCQQLQAQLIYLALPSNPWALSAPVVWDAQTWTGWSSIGIDDGKPGVDTVSFVVYNLADDKLPHTYTLNVYDSTGALFSSGTTGLVAYLGSYARGVRDVITNVPTGEFKLQLVAAANQWVAFEALQFHGTTATTLVSAWENPVLTAGAASAASVSATPGSKQPAAARRRTPPSSLAH
jgi:hypothetical protein